VLISICYNIKKENRKIEANFASGCAIYRVWIETRYIVMGFLTRIYGRLKNKLFKNKLEVF